MGRLKAVVAVLAFVLTCRPEGAGAAGESYGEDGAFRVEMSALARRLRLPGLSVAVVRDGETVLVHTDGYANLERKAPIADDSIFWLSSLTKTFAAAMVMQYVREGRLRLDDPVTRYPFTSVGFFPQRVDANLQLIHVLSQTSENVPGDQFVYHGGRFNFLYGAFEAMSGLKAPRAFEEEVERRILEPLGLKDTLTGYPDQGDPRAARLVTPYSFDAERRTFVINESVSRFDTAYPATGLLSSVSDLAAYAKALDEHRLVTRAEYAKMTDPFITNAGHPMPYGLGWFTQEVAGVRLHWVYGLGDSDSSILLRVPDRKLTLIALSNSTLLSEPARLGSGDALRSPFVLAFLRHFVLGAPPFSEPSYLRAEELYTEALTSAFLERAFGAEPGKAAELLRRLYEMDRARFMRNDPTLAYLLAEVPDGTLDEAADLFNRTYEASGRFHPWILHAIGLRHERKGKAGEALRYYHALADTPGFEEQADTMDACARLGAHYMERRDFARAREYVWRALVDTRQAGYDETAVQRQLDELNRATSPGRSR
jgi:CubicO group peptidase (beta-lactamase class C family)